MVNTIIYFQASINSGAAKILMMDSEKHINMIATNIIIENNTRNTFEKKSENEGLPYSSKTEIVNDTERTPYKVDITPGNLFATEYMPISDNPKWVSINGRFSALTSHHIIVLGIKGIV